jgi:hypothetical protein
LHSDLLDVHCTADVLLVIILHVRVKATGVEVVSKAFTNLVLQATQNKPMLNICPMAH